MFFGRQDMPVLGSVKSRHYIEKKEPPDNRRTIDAQRERVRRILEQISEYATVLQSEVIAQKTRFYVTNVYFAPGRAELDDKDRKFLTEFYERIPQGFRRYALKTI